MQITELIQRPLALPEADSQPLIQAGRFDYIDLMRAIAITMVVAIHVASTYFYNSEMAAAATSNWKASAWVMSFLRPAVPLFLMISGTLLLQPSKASESISHFFRKRISRILAPFVIWSAAFICWRIFFLNEALTLGDAISAFFKDTVYVHFWFMYVLLALYMMTPVLRKFTKHASQTHWASVFGIWFIVKSLMPLIKSWWGFELQLLNHIPVTGYIGFFLGGYYLSRIKVSKPVHRILPSIYVAGAIITGAITLHLNGTGDVLNDVMYSNFKPNTILMATCLYLWLKHLDYRHWASQHVFCDRWIKLLSRFSFGIYLMHLMLVDLFQSTHFMGLQINALPLSAFLTIPLFSVIVLALSILILALLSRLPGGRLISP